MNNEPEESGEMINDGAMITFDDDAVEVHGDPIFIPKAWREQLGCGHDD